MNKQRVTHNELPGRGLGFFFQHLKIRAKILLVLILVSVASVALFGYMDYQEAKRTLRDESFKKLTAVREMKAQQIENYFNTISGQVVTFSESRTVVEAMLRFKEAFSMLPKDAAVDEKLVDYYKKEFLPRLRSNTRGDAAAIQHHDFVPTDPAACRLQLSYIANNPNPTGEKHKLDSGDDQSRYSSAHAVYHPIIRNYLEKFGFYDIFLIDHETGHIVYSVFKEVDFGTSLLSGPYRDTNFSDVFKQAQEAENGSFVVLKDFQPYSPSYDAPASFIASPIFDDGEKIGVLVFQMPIDRINDVMTSRQSWQDVGLGASGETYLVGEDYLMRNQSRFLIEDRENYLDMIQDIGLSNEVFHRIKALETSIGLQPVRTKGTEAALGGASNTEIFPDYRGVPVLSSYRLLELPDVTWAIMSEIDEAEAMVAATRLRNRTLLLLIVFIVVITGVSFIFAKTMTRPIKLLTEKAKALAQGDLGIPIDVAGGDEIAQLGRSFDAMRKALAELIGGLEKKVEERTAELGAKTELLETTIESLSHPFYVINADDYSIALKNSAADQVGAEGASTCHALTHRRDTPCDSEDDPCPLEIIKKTKAPVVLEHTHFDKDGRARFAEVHGYPIFDDAGEVCQMIEYSLDITERKAIEQRVQTSEERLRSIIESVIDGIVVVDKAGIILEFSPAAQRIFGYSRDEAVGKNVTIIIPDHFKERHESSMREYLGGRDSRIIGKQVEVAGLRKDGSEFPLDLSIAHATVGGEHLFTGILRDITDRKAVESRLTLQSTALQSAANTIVITDVDGRIEWANEALTKLTGYQPAEAIGKSPRMFKSGTHDEAFYAEMWNALMSKSSWHGELVNKRKDGAFYNEEMTITPVLGEDDEIINFVAIKQDITERKEAQQALRKSMQDLQGAYAIIEAQKERMQHELDVGRDIQLSMVPGTFPETSSYALHASLEPAREVGGDFFDFFEVGEDQLFFCVGDVSGKGVPAALFMAVAKTLIKSRASDNPSPSNVLTRVNDELSQDNPSCMFVTVLAVMVNLRTGELRYTSAGHNPPFITRNDGRIEKMGSHHGPVLGAVGGVEYLEDQLQLAQGDTVLLYTDGVTEAKNAGNQLYSEQRLVDLLTAEGVCTARECLDLVFDDVKQFQGSAEQADDITLLAFELLGSSQENVLMDLKITNRIEEIERVDKRITALAAEQEIEKPVERKLRMACDEVLNNIISYGYDDEGAEHGISIVMIKTQEHIKVIIVDDAKAFDPLKQQAPDTESSLEDRDIGGLGIHLVRNLMDSVDYHRDEDDPARNILTLTMTIRNNQQQE